MKKAQKILSLFLVLTLIATEGSLAAEIQEEELLTEKNSELIPKKEILNENEMFEEEGKNEDDQKTIEDTNTQGPEDTPKPKDPEIQEESLIAEEAVLEMITETSEESTDDIEETIPEETKEAATKKIEIEETETPIPEQETLNVNAIYQEDQLPEIVYQKTKQSMLDLKNKTRTLDESSFGRWRQTPKSLLQKEQNGGFSFFGSGGDLEGLDIVTGKASVDDSMQLGNFSSGNEIDKQLIKNVRQAIENFKTNTGTYPDSLEDFRKYEGQWWAEIQINTQIKNMTEIKDKVDYIPKEEKAGKKSILCSGDFEHLTNLDATTVSKQYKDELRKANPTLCQTKKEMQQHEGGCCFFSDTEITSFTLSLKEQKNKNVPLSGLKPVETKSHDFDALIADEGVTAKVPKIAKLVPADSLFLYFDSSEKYQEFAKALNNPLSELHKALPIPTPQKIEEMIAKRLGIPNAADFLSLAEEFAFVGEDIRLFPSSDYAIIVKWKEENTAFIASLLQNGENVFGSVDEYHVFATNQQLFDDIAGLAKGESERSPLSEEKDFYYSLGITEQKRDGFLFFSDAFIRKMVSPEYRISLRRQKTVVDAMNTLQYIVWAYKDLEGTFPKTWEEIEEKGYIERDSIYQKEKYIIGADEIVRHEIWGTPFDITPVTRVAVNTVSEREKVWYAQDRDIYQSRYQQFFDPIGVSITVADKILLHTVILPFSESEEYKTLEAIGGGKTKESFALLENQGAILQGAMALDFDNIIYNFVVWDRFSLPEEELQKKIDERSEEEIMQEAIEKFEQDFKDGILSLSDTLETDEAENIWQGRIFDFLGDEIAFGLEKNMVIDMQDISGIDGYLGILLTNKEKAEKLFNLIFEMLAKEMGGGGFGILQFQGALKNEYNGVKYYVVPTGFLNLYTIFLEDRVYFAVSQNTINNIIDGATDADISFSRLNDFLSGEKNVLLRTDFSLVSEWVDGIPEKFQNDFVSVIFDRTEEKNYAAERMELENIVGEEFMNTYFIHQSEIFGYSPLWKDSGLVWEKGGEQYSSDEIDPSEILASIKKLFEAYGKTGLSFAFTPHGVEIKVAFDNPEQEKIDERFLSGTKGVNGKVAGSENQQTPEELMDKSPPKITPIETDDGFAIPRFVIYGSIGAGISVIFLIIYFLWKRRKDREDKEKPRKKKRPPIDFNNLELDSDIPKHYAQFAKKHEDGGQPKESSPNTENKMPITPPPPPSPIKKESEPNPHDKRKTHIDIDDILQIPKNNKDVPLSEEKTEASEQTEGASE